MDYYIKAQSKTEERALWHTREILASLHNQTLAITSQQAGKRNFKPITGADLIGLPGDKPRAADKTGAERLAEFKESCRLKGIPWNPKKRAEA